MFIKVLPHSLWNFFCHFYLDLKENSEKSLVSEMNCYLYKSENQEKRQTKPSVKKCEVISVRHKLVLIIAQLTSALFEQMELSLTCCLIEHSPRAEVMQVLACPIFLESTCAGMNLVRDLCRATIFRVHDICART